MGCGLVYTWAPGRWGRLRRELDAWLPVDVWFGTQVFVFDFVFPLVRFTLRI